MEFVKVALFESSGVILLALGLYGKYSANGNAFHPLLNDPSTVNGLLILGGFIMMLGAKGVFDILRKKKKLLSENSAL